MKIKHKYLGKVLFESDAPTMRDLIEKANLEGVYLREADLEGADLRGADLEGAYLVGSDLRGSDLRGANLEGANLRGSDLRGSDLRGANLEGANLRGAHLRGANRNNKKIKHFYSWAGLYEYVVEVQVSEDDSILIRLGCHTRTLEEWEANFWNNDNEFPNDGSEASELRLNAYNFAKKWAEIKVGK